MRAFLTLHVSLSVWRGSGYRTGVVGWLDMVYIVHTYLSRFSCALMLHPTAGVYYTTFMYFTARLLTQSFTVPLALPH
ncbi:hypothetical protein C8Q73DRAFT_690865 [Cubamyces lactineus]|nr:hypothetical protein C8Q73DRAFT_690865 [Cubamyces lactineus]